MDAPLLPERGPPGPAVPQSGVVMRRALRRWGSLPKRKAAPLNRPYVTHEAGEDGRPLCGSKAVQKRHLEPAKSKYVMCNDCQRRRWALDVRGIVNGLLRKHREPRW